MSTLPNLKKIQRELAKRAAPQISALSSMLSRLRKWEIAEFIVAYYNHKDVSEYFVVLLKTALGEWDAGFECLTDAQMNVISKHAEELQRERAKFRAAVSGSARPSIQPPHYHPMDSASFFARAGQNSVDILLLTVPAN